MNRLKAFFSYFGSKVSLAGKYPAPIHGTIIEPFAGAAGYACSYHDREVFLYDKNPVVVGVWDFLIRASKADILALPLHATDMGGLSKQERDFIGFWWGRCIAAPGKAPTAWMLSGLYPYSFWSQQTRQRIADQVHAIKHWKVAEASFETIPPRPATWFIDPPYRARGARYPFGSSQIDYEKLGAWVRGLPGQIIACESDEADYLPFRPAFENSTIKYRKQKRTVMELIYAPAPTTKEERTP